MEHAGLRHAAEGERRLVNMRRWTPEERRFFTANYPQKGKVWCMEQLGRTEGSIRWMASMLGLHEDKNSEFFKDFQVRAAQSKVGKKRPDQSIVMKKLHAEGKLRKNKEQLKAMGLRTKAWIAKNGHPKGTLGMHHTKETKTVISVKSKASWARKTEDEQDAILAKRMATRIQNGTLPNERQKTTWKAGWRTIGGIKKYYRSRWEANYARYLEWLRERGEIASWRHESKTFWFSKIKRGCVSYLPDFCVVDNDGVETYYEVKGWMDDRSKTKIKRMAIYFPEVTLVVIEAKDYRDLERNVSGFIKGWEIKGDKEVPSVPTCHAKEDDPCSNDIITPEDYLRGG
jgi:hypothetical protein